MPADKEAKPRYELRRRGKTSYVALWQGKHCLCAICTKTVRGALDAQLILQVMNSHKDLLTACELLIKATQHVRELSLNRDEPHRGMIWGKARAMLDIAKLKALAAIASTKPEQESTL